MSISRRMKTRGFTMFFAVLVSSLALAIGLAIYDLVVRELLLSTTTAQSQYAIYAADTGVECALYWDFKYNGFNSIFPTSTGDGQANAATNALCNGVDVTVGRSIVANANAATTTITLTLSQFYAYVQVTKTQSSTGQVVLTTSSGGSITDIHGNVWTLTSGGSIMENGSPVSGGGGTSALTYIVSTDTIWGQDAGSGQWYFWNGSFWVGPSASTPVASGGVVHTRIYSHGYNTLATTSPSAVERELQVNY